MSSQTFRGWNIERGVTIMNQKFLTILGLIARSFRLIGLGPFLQLNRDLVDFILLRFRKFPLKVYLDGHIIHGCFRHRSFLYHLSKENYAPFTTELFKSQLKPGITVVDCGAHLGFYTLLAAKLVGTKGRVFSFEPDPYNFQCLIFNIYSNKYENVTAIEKAVADRIGNTIFYQNSSTISSSLGNRKETKNFLKGVSIKKVLIQSTTLDSELKDLPVDLIKFNIEGAEPLALQGMTNILQVNRSLTLIAEMNPSALCSIGSSPEILISMLKSYGFDVYFIDELNQSLVLVTGENLTQKGMLYCRKDG